MKRYLLPFSLLIVLCWAATQPAEILTFSAGFFPLRKALILLTGALAFGWMSFTMLLALRPAWLERRMGGLDKLFRAHKWSGIGSVLLVVTHWLLELSPRTLIQWGWVAAPAGARPHRGDGGALLMHLARDGGEWAAWAMIGLGIVALLRFVPYGWFRSLHKAFPVGFLIGAFHSTMLMPDGPFASPLGVLVLLMSFAGSVIAIMSLMQMIGSSRRTEGHVVSVGTHENGIVDLFVQPGAAWPGHRAGQFALLTLDAKEGPHPFTIASDWTPGAALRFTIKPLGDYTRSLGERIRPGLPALIEGPYGRFDFQDNCERQVWVAGGIGLTPFLARLERLAADGGAKSEVHMFYSVQNERDSSFPEGLEDLCTLAGVHLHLRVASRDGLLHAEEIGAFVKERCSVWFCGPEAWGRKLRRTLHGRYGLPSTHFHQEVFQFR